MLLSVGGVAFMSTKAIRDEPEPIQIQMALTPFQHTLLSLPGLILA
jgi:hypothetical protein